MQSKSHFLLHFIPGMLLGSVVGLAFGSLLVATQIPSKTVTTGDILREVSSGEPLSPEVIEALNRGISKNNATVFDSGKIPETKYVVTPETFCLLQELDQKYSTFWMRGDAESAPTNAEVYAGVKEYKKMVDKIIEPFMVEIDRTPFPLAEARAVQFLLDGLLTEYTAASLDERDNIYDFSRVARIAMDMFSGAVGPVDVEEVYKTKNDYTFTCIKDGGVIPDAPLNQ